MRFAVNHRDHDGNLLWTFDNPVDLKWRYQEGKEGPSTCSYGLALSDAGATFRDYYDQDAFAPKRTDFELVLIDNAGGEYPLMAGPIWSMNFTMSEDVVWVSGLDWLAGLYNPYMGFNYSQTITQIVATLDDAQMAQWFSAEKGDTLWDVVDELLTYQTPSEEIVLVPWAEGSAWGQTLDYELWRSDGRSKLDHLQTLAGMGAPWGFDFWADFDKVLHLVGPRLVTPGSVVPIAYFVEGGAIIDGTWTNNGPVATDTIVLGGWSNTGGFKRSVYEPPPPHLSSIDVYRRWTEFVTAEIAYGRGHPSPQAQVNALADSLGTLHRNPQKELTIQVNPYAVDPADETAFFFNHVMKAINVDWRHPSGFHRIDADFWITSMEFEPDDAGAYTCNLTLDQIYR